MGCTWAEFQSGNNWYHDLERTDRYVWRFQDGYGYLVNSTDTNVADTLWRVGGNGPELSNLAWELKDALRNTWETRQTMFASWARDLGWFAFTQETPHPDTNPNRRHHYLLFSSQ